MKGSIGRIIGFCCACIAFYIGAGFATMQEVMQYEASYGSQFWIVIAVAAAIYLYTNWSFAVNGHREKLLRGGDIYTVYCGKWIGKFFDYFSTFFCYMCFIVMCGGANSTAMEQWNMPNGMGAVILAVAVIATVYFGLNSMLKVLKWVGPAIILLILFITGVTAVVGWENFAEGLHIVDSKQYDIVQVGDGNPFASGASYGGFVILWFAAFLAELGAKHNVKEVNTGMAISTVAIFGAAAVCCIALIANIHETWNVGIPALVLARQIHPAFASIFAVIIYLGIFSSACPLLWTGVRKVSEDGTKGYKIATVVGGIIGLVVACLVPYKGVLNVIYGLNGYLGFILVAFMIAKDVKVFIADKKSK